MYDSHVYSIVTAGLKMAKVGGNLEKFTLVPVAE